MKIEGDDSSECALAEENVFDSLSLFATNCEELEWFRGYYGTSGVVENFSENEA